MFFFVTKSIAKNIFQNSSKFKKNNKNVINYIFNKKLIKINIKKKINFVNNFKNKYFNKIYFFKNIKKVYFIKKIVKKKFLNEEKNLIFTNFTILIQFELKKKK